MSPRGALQSRSSLTFRTPWGGDGVGKPTGSHGVVFGGWFSKASQTGKGKQVGIRCLRVFVGFHLASMNSGGSVSRACERRRGSSFAVQPE